MTIIPDINWYISKDLVSYPFALDEMRNHVDAIINEGAKEKFWLLQHEDVYTAGTSASKEDMLNPKFPIYKTGRGGKYTYHGPGQLITYIMVDLTRHNKDIRRFIYSIEEWVIVSLKTLNIEAFRQDGMVGIWVNDKTTGEVAKIGAIGVRLSKWVSFHGFSLNLDPDLSAYDGIIPCGIDQHPITSLKQQGVDISFEQMAKILKDNLSVFYATLED